MSKWDKYLDKKWDKVSFWVDTNLHSRFVMDAASQYDEGRYQQLARWVLSKTLRRIENAVNGVRYDPNR